MTQPCGCCSGLEAVTPLLTTNRPGLDTLAYRVGTHATFLETMLARLTGLDPLQRLTTRSADDPSIAWLDAWATVADVLTFYQERIANEGYLRTAVERRSILELARLIGYRARPGVAASVNLAFTVADGFKGDLPAGTRAQSTPLGPNEHPQFFETSEALSTRDVWNVLKPQLTQPQVVTLHRDSGTDAATRRTLYFQGIAPNLKTGDALLIVLGTGKDEQVLRFVQAADVQADAGRTEVVLRRPPPPPNEALPQTLSGYVAEAATLFPTSRLAREVSGILTELLSGVGSSLDQATFKLVRDALQRVQGKLTIARRRKLTRLAAWIAGLLDDRTVLLPLSVGQPVPVTGSPLSQLDAILAPLALPASLRSAGSARLRFAVLPTFAPDSDLAPQILGVVHRVAAPFLYLAWANVVAPSAGVDVYVVRAKASLFASTYPGDPVFTAPKSASAAAKAAATAAAPAPGSTTYTPPNLTTAWGTLINATNPPPPSAVALDAVYDQIKPGSWVVIDRPRLPEEDPASGDRAVTGHTVTSLRTVSMAASGFTAKVTQLTLSPPWLKDLELPPGSTQQSPGLLDAALKSTDVLRGTIVYVQTEALELAEEPIDGDVEGRAIELDRLRDGLEVGRLVALSGPRTDIPHVTGVTGSELALISGITQAGQGVARTTLVLADTLAYAYDAATVTVYGNVVDATQGQTVAEVLGSGDGRQAFQTFALHQAPLTYVSAPTANGAESTLVARVNDVEWHETDSQAGLTPSDHGFVTETDDADRTTVTFGNGRYGARLPTGANVKAVYRYGSGEEGNVQAGQINQLATRPPGAKDVINPLPATGGASRDSGAQMRRNAPLAVMALDRLVSTDDYADFARTFAGIGKAVAVRLSDGHRQVVHVTIAGVNDGPIASSSDLYRNLGMALHRFGDPGQPIRLALRRLKLLVVRAGVRVGPDYRWELVEPKVRAALVAALGFERRDLGQSAFSSEVVSAIQAVDGVAYVDLRVFDALPENITVDRLAALAGQLTWHPYVEAELAHVAPAAVDPARPLLPAELVVLRPDLAGTLVLTEIDA